MDKLYCKRNVDEYIRKELGASVRGEIHEGHLNEAFKKLIQNACERMKLEERKTILKHHL